MTGSLLVTGGTGYLGAELLRQAAGRSLAATWLGTEPERGGEVAWLRLDVRDESAVREALERLRPSAVVHTAYRQDGEGARETTVDGAAAVAVGARSVGARLVHLSSDVIFDGEKEGPYTEGDPPSPITDYGRAKADAERVVAEAQPDALIVRTSLIYGGPQPSRHERLALEAARGEGGMSFFDDELRCPVAVGDLAGALLRLVERPETGVLNLAGSERLSRYEFACLVARAANLPSAGIARGSIAAAGLARPRNCTLDSSRAAALLGRPLPGARERLEARLAGEVEVDAVSPPGAGE